MIMGKAKLTKVTLSVTDAQEKSFWLELLPEGRSFKAVPYELSFGWRKLVKQLNHPSISEEQISLTSKDYMSADTELRRLFHSIRGMNPSRTTKLHFIKDGLTFTVTINPVNVQCNISTQPSKKFELTSKNPRAAAYVTVLEDSEYCRSVEMLSYGGIAIQLSEKHAAPSRRIAVCEALINLS